MHTLSNIECETVASIIADCYGSALSWERFAEVALDLFEDISGLETISPRKAKKLINQTWSIYMPKKPAASEIQNPSPLDSEKAKVAQPPDLTQPAVKAAIDNGKALIAEGKSKADAARSIFEVIKSEPKELIVAAFVEGATLTEKGALTYWYNCRRKESKRKVE